MKNIEKSRAEQEKVDITRNSKNPRYRTLNAKVAGSTPARPTIFVENREREKMAYFSHAFE